ncbi:MAG TPA: ribosome-associated translation inhibitor RaiA [Ferrovibrio sp.]|uniref:ribosome hibernation-promoting factor, HPF/YfiA family n=1 Tax=Ferrovibrio sp. TaxID=1917215 RepID=UPI002B4B8AB1|nr:ribosome-associated translation inhibitor RaiA [Ferrovibrio sp.]HLT76511.1 ribosome-associated translation inhibitor RaiA [Ferrovibrio sp.]
MVRDRHDGFEGLYYHAAPSHIGSRRIMNIQISGQQIDLGESLRTYVTDKLGATVSKYMDNAVGAQVVFRRDASGFLCTCSVHIGADIDMHAEGEAQDIYCSFDVTLEKLAKQLRRDKRKRRNHHTRTPTAESNS